MKGVSVTAAGLLLCMSLIVGCTTRLTDFTVLSTKNVDLSKMASYTRGISRVHGEDLITIIIFIPTGVPNAKEAIDRAIQSVPGAIALVDGVVYQKAWWFLIGQSGFMVEGTPLIDPSLTGGHTQLKSNYMLSFFNPQTKQQEVRYLDKETFATARQAFDRHDEKAMSELLVELQ
ncbi:MAG: hypothetical protein ACLPT4_16280 [Verrucomicrobiia bacterium]